MIASIIIPSFNRARWLAQAIESALAQDIPTKEVIVVDDGSTDGSPDVARQFGDRIQLLVGENRGGNHARNRGVGVARGEWLQFLDADDYLQPEKIAQQLTEARGGLEADVIYSPTITDDVRAETMIPGKIDLDLDLFSRWFAWELPQTGGALWRRSALEQIGRWKEGQPCCQEHEVYLRALQAGLRFHYAPTPHAVYRIWSEETVCRADPRKVIRVRTELMDRLQDWLEKSGQWTPVHARVAGQQYFQMSRTLALHDLDEAAAYYRERKKRGLITIAGPAATPRYRFVHRLLGFTLAEKLANAQR